MTEVTRPSAAHVHKLFEFRCSLMSGTGNFVTKCNGRPGCYILLQKFPSAGGSGTIIPHMASPQMPRSRHILVVDDDNEIRSLVAQFLNRHGFRVETVADGTALMERFEAGQFDLVVLDLMLPGEDGLSLCRRLRADSDIPIIMLTAVGEPTDRIVGLEMGADDYMPKPFNPRELLARIRAVLRRSDDRAARARYDKAGGELLKFLGWRFNLFKRELQRPDGVLVPLTAGEFDLLAVLLENPRRVMNRDQLLDQTRGREASPFDRSIDVQISRLRRKIERDPKEPALIKTVRGGGYVLSCEVTRE